MGTRDYGISQKHASGLLNKWFNPLHQRRLLDTEEERKESLRKVIHQSIFEERVDVGQSRTTKLHAQRNEESRTNGGFKFEFVVLGSQMEPSLCVRSLPHNLMLEGDVSVYLGQNDM